MRQVATGRAGSDAMLIDVEKKLVVGADAHDEMHRGSFESEEFAKVENVGIADRHVRTSDPMSCPSGEVWSGLRRNGHCYDQQKCVRDGNEKSAPICLEWVIAGRL